MKLHHNWSFVPGAVLIALRLVLGYGFAADTDPRLKLHLDFDGDFSGGRVMDSSGNGNDGWQFNSTNWISATNGVFGSTAAQFTYVGFMSNDVPHVYPLSQYIAVTNTVGINYLTNGTISFWARFETNGDLGMMLLDTGYTAGYADNPNAASNSWTLGRLYTPYLAFTVYPYGQTGRPIVFWPNDVDYYTLSTTSFHLYTITIDCPNNRAVSYYDGVPYMTGSIDLPWIRIYGCASQRWLCIGAMAHDGTPQWGDDRYPNSGYFVGKMDDLRIYNDTLSASEVQALYRGSTYAQNLGVQKAVQQSVQLSWPTKSNATYQVEYQPTPLLGPWTALGLAIPGSGQTNSIFDSIVGQSSRFYRVRVLP